MLMICLDAEKLGPFLAWGGGGLWTRRNNAKPAKKKRPQPPGGNATCHRPPLVHDARGCSFIGRISCKSRAAYQTSTICHHSQWVHDHQFSADFHSSSCNTVIPNSGNH
jgi:hypothetical protein